MKIRGKEIGLKPYNLAVDTSDLHELQELLDHKMPKFETRICDLDAKVRELISQVNDIQEIINYCPGIEDDSDHG